MPALNLFANVIRCNGWPSLDSILLLSEREAKLLGSGINVTNLVIDLLSSSEVTEAFQESGIQHGQPLSSRYIDLFSESFQNLCLLNTQQLPYNQKTTFILKTGQTNRNKTLVALLMYQFIAYVST